MSCDEGVRAGEQTETRVLTPAEIRIILGDEAADERERRQLAKVVNLVDCPTPECTSRFELAEDVDERETYCQLCRKRVELRRPNLWKRRRPPPADSAAEASSSSGGADDGTSTGQANEEAEDSLAEQRAFMVRFGLQQCPDCGNAIEKKHRSCNKFQCTCGCRFCWKCGERANARGIYTCQCTSAEHVAWDNVRNRPATATQAARPSRGQGQGA